MLIHEFPLHVRFVYLTSYNQAVHLGNHFSNLEVLYLNRKEVWQACNLVSTRWRQLLSRWMRSWARTCWLSCPWTISARWTNSTTRYKHWQRKTAPPWKNELGCVTEWKRKGFLLFGWLATVTDHFSFSVVCLIVRKHICIGPLLSLFGSAFQLEGEKNKLENLLKNNLMKRKDRILLELQEDSEEDRKNKLEMYKAELESVSQRISGDVARFKGTAIQASAICFGSKLFDLWC